MIQKEWHKEKRQTHAEEEEEGGRKWEDKERITVSFAIRQPRL